MWVDTGMVCLRVQDRFVLKVQVRVDTASFTFATVAWDAVSHLSRNNGAKAYWVNPLLAHDCTSLMLIYCIIPGLTWSACDSYPPRTAIYCVWVPKQMPGIKAISLIKELCACPIRKWSAYGWNGVLRIPMLTVVRHGSPEVPRQRQCSPCRKRLSMAVHAKLCTHAA